MGLVSFAPPGLAWLLDAYPRLAPWAAFLRRSAAVLRSRLSIETPFEVANYIYQVAPPFRRILAKGGKLQIDAQCIPILSRTERETRMGHPKIKGVGQECPTHTGSCSTKVQSPTPSAPLRAGLVAKGAGSLGNWRQGECARQSTADPSTVKIVPAGRDNLLRSG